MQTPATKAGPHPAGTATETTADPAGGTKTAAVEAPQQIPLWADRLTPVPALTSAPAVQFRLAVNAPGDKFEQEAERVADQVTSSSGPQRMEEEEDEGQDADSVEHVMRLFGPSVQRQGQETQDEEPAAPQAGRQDIGADPAAAELDGPAPQEVAPPDRPQAALEPGAFIGGQDELPLAPGTAADAPLTGEDLRRRLENLAGGVPLSAAERAYFEARFNRDFSQVRLHTGSGAAALAAALQARAFTLGSHIVFNRAEYAPASRDGRHLLAHELTHVVQQGRGPERSSHRSAGAARRPAGAMAGRPAPGPTIASPPAAQRLMIQRAPEEAQKFGDVVDYKKARQDNLDTWYEQYKFYNLFKEEGIYPGSHPVAYANHVYQLQMRLEELWGEKVPGDPASGPAWAAAEPGILEKVVDADSTIVRLAVVAQRFKKDPSYDHRLNPKMLERISAIFGAFEKGAPPLVSELFAGVRQLEAVNRNKLFYIQFDDRGEYVVRLQRGLLALNYNLGRDVKTNPDTKEQEVSGVFGKDTKKAVTNFQQDSGFTGKDADGVVGQMTLRLLDKRLGAPLFKPGASGGNTIVVHVPVTADDLLVDKEQLKQDLLLRALKVAFPITDDQTDILRRAGWHWTMYQDLTQAEVEQGYKPVGIRKTAYEGVMGQVATSTGTPAGVPVEEKLTGQTLDLLKTGKLYALNKRISELESLIRSVRSSGDPEMHGRDVDWDAISKYRAELESAKQERQQELNRLGLTLDEYEKLQTDFISTFERFALLVAFRMLAENEMQANIEAQHYENIEEVKALKTILGELAGKYAESQKLWWESVSEAEGYPRSYYANEADYKAKNTDYAEGPGHRSMKIESFNTAYLFSESNVAKKYASLEKTPEPAFAAWQGKEKEVVSTLQTATKKYPILAYPKLELRRNAGSYAGKDEGELQKMVLGIIRGSGDDKGIKQNIAATREALASNPGKVWELPVVILQAQNALGVVEGVPVELIKAKQEAVADKSFWENIGLAILGIGLGLLALLSGPAGWLALGASIVVGGYDAYRTYQDITFKKQTAGTAIDPASALGLEDPSYFWFWVSLISVGIDVAQFVKVVKAVAKGIELAEDAAKALSKARTDALARLANAGGEATAEGKAILKEIDEIDELLAKVSATDYAKNVELLKPLSSNPMAVAVMGEALKNKKIATAITALGRIVEKDVFENALRFYASVGRNSLDELPELLRLVKEGGLETNKKLVGELLADPRVQRVLLDSQDPNLLGREFKAWEDAIKAGEAKSFVQHLEALNLNTRLAADTKLVDMFGEAFAALPNTVKNRQILRTVEPRLLDAFNAGELSPELTRGLEVLLNSDVLAESTRLSSAQARLQHELAILGSLLETQSDFAKVASLLNSPVARRALWEGANNLAGKADYVALITKANGGKLPGPDIMDDLIRIGPMTDQDTVAKLIAADGEKLRKALVLYPEAAAVLKKCASPCLPPFATPEQVAQVARIMEGKSADDLLRIREYLYTNRTSQDIFTAAVNDLEHNFADTLKNTKLPVLQKPARLDVAEPILRSIIDQGVEVSRLNAIMSRAATIPNGTAVIYDLNRVLQLRKSVTLKNFDLLLEGLTKTDAAEFRAARHLLDEAERFVAAADGFTYGGLQKADALLGRFSLTELNSLMGSRWSNSFVGALYDVAAKVPDADNAKLFELIKKAGGGKAPGDLERLVTILASGKNPTMTIDEAVKAIDAADAFVAAVAKAMADPTTGYDAMIKLVWGEGAKVEGGVIKVSDAAAASGSAAYKTVFPPGGEVTLGKLFGGPAGINGDKWKVFRKVIEDADVPEKIKGNILGEMWTQANAAHYRSLGYTVLYEVGLKTTKDTARADLVLLKGNELIIVECKSGRATYERGQKIIYPLLEQGDFRSVIISGDEALVAKYADPKTKLGFIPRREAEIVK